MTKYVFVTGGVVSGLGKGIVAASLGRLIKQRGYKVASVKLDPYMNVDPGTMNPVQHGEVYVTDDGAETDLDLGHYERFIDEPLTKFSNLTSGRVYQRVIDRERNGEYGGKTVQIVPHVTDEIKAFIRAGAKESGAQVLITEIGGTTGDIESRPFIEAVRQFGLDVGRENCVFIHVCLVPYISGSDEYKSKPVQHSVKELMGMGIAPDVIVTRSDGDCGEAVREKISLFCCVDRDCVIPSLTVPCLYEAPLMLHDGGLDKVVCRKLKLRGKCDLKEWKRLIGRANKRKGEVEIAIVGKYVSLHDSYLSVVEALNHASFAEGVFVKVRWVDSEEIERTGAEKALRGADGVLVPGGFGVRGTQGMIDACEWARNNGVPYFGICLGMQIAVIEFARHVAGIADATSGEFGEGSKVIDILPDKKGKRIGGTLRLGAYPCAVLPGTRLASVYGSSAVSERHRHRYEFNNAFLPALTKAGLRVGGTSPDGSLVEAIETDGAFFVGVQFHPEFTSRPNRPHPIFRAFVAAAKEYKVKK